MKTIGIITSGGDAPGMNAAVRAAVRTATWQGMNVVAFEGGYDGVVKDIAYELSPRSVSNLIQRGGTFIHTGRSEEFITLAGRKKAADSLRRRGIDGFIVVGGDGSFKGAIELAQVWDGKIIGAPGTIDNDLWGTDFTIGFDTAVNTALESIDKIRDTAEAHKRAFIIEVMGRHAGFIAIAVGVAGGAEEIIFPEYERDIEEMARELKEDQNKGKQSLIMVAAEGSKAGTAVQIADKLRELAGIDSRVTVLGHVQRGGSPTAADRLLGTKLGAFAVESLLEGNHLMMAGERAGEPVLVPLADAVEKRKPIDRYLVKLMRILAS